jgi:hypothetical protein
MHRDKVFQLCDETVAGLKKAAGDQDQIEAAIRRYIDRGDRLGMSPYDLWDFFAISSPSIPEQAGYGGYECDKMVAVFERMSKERFGGD